MVKATNYEIVKITVRGEPIDIKIKKELAWGEFIELVKTFDFGGEQDIDSLIEALHILLKVGTIDSPIDIEDRTTLFQLPAGDVTRLVGEIRKILPLEKYLANLGLSTEEIAAQTITAKKTKKA